MLAAQGLREGEVGKSRILDKDQMARVKREARKVWIGSFASATVFTTLLAFAA